MPSTSSAGLPAEVERRPGGEADPEVVVEDGDRGLRQVVEQHPLAATDRTQPQQRRDQGEACDQQAPS